MTIKEYAEKIWDEKRFGACDLHDFVEGATPILIELVRESRENCRRIAVQKSVLWTEYEDSQSQEYRRGVEEGACSIAKKIMETQP